MSGQQTEVAVIDYIAPAWKRYGAGLVDWLILVCLWLGIFYNSLETVREIWPDIIYEYFYLLIPAVFFFLYAMLKVLFHMALGSTLGKMLFGLMVVDRLGHKVSTLTAIKRYSVELVIVTLMVALMVYFYWFNWQELNNTPFGSIEYIMRDIENYKKDAIIELAVDFSPSAWLLLNSVMLVFNRSRLSLRDRLAKTLVVDDRKYRQNAGR